MSNNITPVIKKQAIATLKENFNGTIIQSRDKSYEKARHIWNGMIDKKPAVIARCLGKDDVVQAVNFARKNKLEISIRGGGHNVSGSALNNGGIVIDMSEMNEVYVDAENKTARALGGAILGNIDNETQKYGLVTPLGVVSKTGIAGLTLNGGIGHLRRKYGLSCDNLKSVEIVTGDGRVKTASPELNPNLFWAIRGGGGNFGVVISFEYQLYELKNDIYGVFSWYPGNKITEGLKQFREYAKTASNDSSMLAFLAFVPRTDDFPRSLWSKPAFVLFGCHCGNNSSVQQELRPLLNFSDPIADFSGFMPYNKLQTMLDEEYPDGRRYYWKSVFLDDLNEEVINMIEQSGETCPSGLSTIDIWHLDGAINETDQNDTAFWHRDKPFMLTYEANWIKPSEDEKNVEWVRDNIKQAKNLTTSSGGYGNFPGFNEDSAQSIFGNNYERLVMTKQIYDPENLFNFNLNYKP